MFTAAYDADVNARRIPNHLLERMVGSYFRVTLENTTSFGDQSSHEIQIFITQKGWIDPSRPDSKLNNFFSGAGEFQDLGKPIHDIAVGTSFDGKRTWLKFTGKALTKLNQEDFLSLPQNEVMQELIDLINQNCNLDLALPDTPAKLPALPKDESSCCTM